LSNPRIIAGIAGGIRLQSVPGDSTRPITDRVKEALFNIIGQDIVDTSLLDLFGGTGSVGIEALSRGAKFVRMIDRNHNAVTTIKNNLKTTHFSNQADVLMMDSFALIHRPVDRQFEYIYIAPPQYKQMWAQAMHLLDENPGWLTSDGWIIVQIHPVEYEILTLKNFVEFDQRKYGSTLLVFYEFNANSNSKLDL
jgi:16S rRNA (guanine966-N2)-methyltransferase